MLTVVAVLPACYNGYIAVVNESQVAVVTVERAFQVDQQASQDRAGAGYGNRTRCKT